MTLEVLLAGDDAGGPALASLPTHAVRARRRPWALAGLWAWESAVALVAAAPVASLVNAAYGTDPAGDAPLFAPGGRALLDLVWREPRGLHASAMGALAVLALGAVLGLVPLGATLTALSGCARDGRAAGWRACLSEGVRLVPLMALLALAAVAGQAILAVAGSVASALVEAGLHDRLGEARAQQAAVAIMLLAAAAIAAVGVAHDLACAAAVRLRASGGRAIVLGATALARAPGSALWGWGWRAAAALAPVALAAWVAARLGDRGAAALLALAAVHQAVLVARLAVRMSWLAKAVRTVDATVARDQPDDSDR